MKLIICYGEYGHLALAENDVVKDGTFAGLNQREMFERIMKGGYGNNVPAVFHAEYGDGSSKIFKAGDAAGLIDDPSVKEVTVLAPMAGGAHCGMTSARSVESRIADGSTLLTIMSLSNDCGMYKGKTQA